MAGERGVRPDVSPSGPEAVDLLGGGINGESIARDAAGRGLDVLLCEKDDLAARTSSASTRLVHGGLRYKKMRRMGCGACVRILESGPGQSFPIRR